MGAIVSCQEEEMMPPVEPGGASMLRSGWILECAFIICPRTPTEPICSPALLSSSAAASCVVTTLRFILSPIVVLGSPGILIQCASLQFLQQQQPPPAFMSTEEEAPEHLCQGYLWGFQIKRLMLKMQWNVMFVWMCVCVCTSLYWLHSKYQIPRLLEKWGHFGWLGLG